MSVQVFKANIEKKRDLILLYIVNNLFYYFSENIFIEGNEI
jgi:hypothetical protein